MYHHFNPSSIPFIFMSKIFFIKHAVLVFQKLKTMQNELIHSLSSDVVIVTGLFSSTVTISKIYKDVFHIVPQFTALPVLDLG